MLAFEVLVTKPGPEMAGLLARRGGGGRTLLAYVVARGLTCASGAMFLRPGEAEHRDEQTILFIRHAEGWHNKDSRELENWKSDKLGLTEKYHDALCVSSASRVSDVCVDEEEKVFFHLKFLVKIATNADYNLLRRGLEYSRVARGRSVVSCRIASDV